MEICVKEMGKVGDGNSGEKTYQVT